MDTTTLNVSLTVSLPTGVDEQATRNAISEWLYSLIGRRLPTTDDHFLTAVQVRLTDAPTDVHHKVVIDGRLVAEAVQRSQDDRR